VAREPNERIRADFWKSSAVNRLPYWRGELVALDFARLLERAGTTLEAVLREIAAHPDSRTATERFAVAAARHLPAALPNLEAYVERGHPIPADVGALGACFEGRRLARAPFALGFDGPASFAARKVIGLVPGSAAEHAGLGEGMGIVAGSVRYGEADSEVKLTVRQEGSAREIAFMPRGAPIPVMQYTVRDDARRDAACLAWMKP
jgi:predicted metalloprotease with PDZ domain